MATNSQNHLAYFLEAGSWALSTMKNSMLTSQFIKFTEESIDYLLQFIDIYPVKSLEDIKRFKYAKTYWKEDFGGACRKAKKIFNKARESGNPLSILLACGEGLQLTTSGIVKFCNRYPYLTSTAIATVRIALAAALFTFAPFSTLVIAGISLGPSAFAGATYSVSQLIQKAIFGTPNKHKPPEPLDEGRKIKLLNMKHQILEDLDKLCKERPELKTAFSLAEDLANIQLKLKNFQGITTEQHNINPLVLIKLGLKEEQIKKLASPNVNLNPAELSDFINAASGFQVAYNNRLTLDKYKILHRFAVSGDTDLRELQEEVHNKFRNYNRDFESHLKSNFPDQFTFYTEKFKDFQDLSQILRKNRAQKALDESFKIDKELYNTPLGINMQKLVNNPITKELGLVKIEHSQQARLSEIITPNEDQKIQQEQRRREQEDKDWAEYERRRRGEIMAQDQNRQR